MSNRGVILVAASACFVATQAILVKLAYATGVNVVTALTLRFAFASVIFFVCLYIGGQSLKVAPRNRRLLGFIIFVHIILDALVFESYSLLPASLAIMFLYAYPAFTGILAYFIFHEKLGAIKISALMLSGCGIVMLLWGSWNSINFLGVFMALAAAVAYAIYLIFLPGLLGRVHKLTFSTWMFAVSTVAYLLVGLVFGGLDFNFAPAGWFYLIATSLISSVAATLALLYGLPLVGATQGAIILTLEPPITIFLGYLVFKEVLTGLQIFGAILILLAVVLPQVLDWRVRKSPRDIGEKA